MFGRIVILALLGAALFTGFQFVPQEKRETIQKQVAMAWDAMPQEKRETIQKHVAMAWDAMSDFYTSCSTRYVDAKTFTLAMCSRALNSTTFVDAKAYALAKYSGALNSTVFVDAKTYALAKYSKALDSTMFVDAKTYALAKYTQALDSAMLVDAKAYASVAYERLLSRAKGLSSTQQAILVGVSVLMVAAVLAVSCRRRRAKVLASAPEAVGSADVSTIAETQAANTLEMRTDESVPPSALRRRKSRLDSPRPSLGNNENEAPLSNCTMGSAAFLSKCNSGTDEELLLIPGLGEKSVAKIVKYRSKHGEIHEIDELVGKVGLSRVIVTKIAKVHGL
jgi:hypothetical protein